MARSTINNSVAKSIIYSLGGSTAACLIGSILVGMLLLSLIPIYISNTSQNGYGEIYTIQGLTIKAIYTNVTANFTGGSVISLAGLSNLCTAIFRANNVEDFYACVATNFTAYGPTGNTVGSSVIRRRELNDVALYEIGDMKLLFWNTCSNKRALGYWFYSLLRTQNSSCVARRATACQTFIKTPNAGNLYNQWSPFPTSYTQLVVTNVTACAAITISAIYNVYYYNYAYVYGYFYNGTESPSHPGDCQYSSIVPQTYLAGLVNNQTTANISTCTGVVG